MGAMFNAGKKLVNKISTHLNAPSYIKNSNVIHDIKDTAIKAVNTVDNQVKQAVSNTATTAERQYGTKYMPGRDTMNSIFSGGNDYIKVKDPDSYQLDKHYGLTNYGWGVTGGLLTLGAVNNTGEAIGDINSTDHIGSIGTITPVNPIQSASNNLTPANAFDNMGASGDINFALRRNNIKAPGTL